MNAVETDVGRELAGGLKAELSAKQSYATIQGGTSRQVWSILLSSLYHCLPPALVLLLNCKIRTQTGSYWLHVTHIASLRVPLGYGSYRTARESTVYRCMPITDAQHDCLALYLHNLYIHGIHYLNVKQDLGDKSSKR